MPKKRLAVGLLAHVDAGKTTLTEAMLYRAGCLRKLGRVDHRDAFLDTEALERERGITIFSKTAQLSLPGADIALLDTPGHVDFAAEAERVLQILDYAVLVVSAADGMQGHTLTLWRLLARYRVPVLLFVNKMDLPVPGRQELLAALCARLGEGCVDFTALAGPEKTGREAAIEALALCEENAMEELLETGRLCDETVARLVAERRVFPCYFGSALRLEGIEPLLEGLERFTRMPAYGQKFAARVYKISRDKQGARLSWMKITGGEVRVRAMLEGRDKDGPWREKADALRLYSGEKFTPLETAPAGMVCAVTGLEHTWPGEGLGAEGGGAAPLLRPVMAYQLLLPVGCDAHAALEKLSQLEEEDPSLQIAWDPARRQIRLQLMGQVQLEVLERLIRDRFGLAVGFGPGRVLYTETIARPVVGVGHFEPLRHYAEVQLLLEPGARGSGLRFVSRCSEDALGGSWQNQILESLAAKEHRGVLSGAPLTDIKITLLAGKAHLKHTEGGDFRQAACRAVRQGLMQARAAGQCLLLEPWLGFRIELPAPCVGRALLEVQRMGGEAGVPEPLPAAADGAGPMTLLTGAAPAAALQGFGAVLAGFTGGRGRMSSSPAGSRPCTGQAAEEACAGYDPERDADNPADSVFCSHGAGVLVRWDEAAAHMHLPPASAQQPFAPAGAQPAAPAGGAKSRVRPGSVEEDAELKAIFERTYGAGSAGGRRAAPGALAKERALQRAAENLQKAKKTGGAAPQSAAGEGGVQDADAQNAGPEAGAAKGGQGQPPAPGPDYLLVDGYNIIFAWEELAKLAAAGLDMARGALMDILCNYKGFAGCEVILVFDAYRVAGGAQRVERYHNIQVVYTREAETADMFIERATYELGKRAGRHGRVRVATSDGAEQMIILGHGALRVPARAFYAEVQAANGRIDEILRRHQAPLTQTLPLSGQ